ncbi:unnamed protein product [Paramecium octaurelia]|uniref:Uncharacterized protein n=1 Tax=Paramecium octaurelia TaxID=43137 RepID=A0A8S1XPP0_PAROT|nr:unnamed protein product [Paramecium octaurelia]
MTAQLLYRIFLSQSKTRTEKRQFSDLQVGEKGEKYKKEYAIILKQQYKNNFFLNIDNDQVNTYEYQEEEKISLEIHTPKKIRYLNKSQLIVVLQREVKIDHQFASFFTLTVNQKVFQKKQWSSLRYRFLLFKQHSSLKIQKDLREHSLPNIGLTFVGTFFKQQSEFLGIFEFESSFFGGDTVQIMAVKTNVKSKEFCFQVIFRFCFFVKKICPFSLYQQIFNLQFFQFNYQNKCLINNYFQFLLSQTLHYPAFVLLETSIFATNISNQGIISLRLSLEEANFRITQLWFLVEDRAKILWIKQRIILNYQNCNLKNRLIFAMYIQSCMRFYTEWDGMQMIFVKKRHPLT